MLYFAKDSTVDSNSTFPVSYYVQSSEITTKGSTCNTFFPHLVLNYSFL